MEYMRKPTPRWSGLVWSVVRLLGYVDQDTVGQGGRLHQRRLEAQEPPYLSCISIKSSRYIEAAHIFPPSPSQPLIVACFSIILSTPSDQAHLLASVHH
ncbi:hypothetical protein HDV64DRAFT_77861 [Trichoderma sp. TUCIM 5745]